MANFGFEDNLKGLIKELDGLPRGYISRKVKGNKVYYYHQWSEEGVKKSRYLSDGEVPGFVELLKRRNEVKTAIEALNDSCVCETVLFRCILMHKNSKVAEIELNNRNAEIAKLNRVFNVEYLPVGTLNKAGECNVQALRRWWSERSIPESRDGLNEALQVLDVNNKNELLIKCFGLSLTDTYWVCPYGSNLDWKYINFFENNFSNTVGDALFDSVLTEDKRRLSSPDSTSNGDLRKRWKIIEGRRCLVKGGNNPYRQEPFNEVLASKIAKRLGIECVDYNLVYENGNPYCVCSDFVSADNEFVSAWRISLCKKKGNSVPLNEHFLNCAEELGISGVSDFLDKMIVFDFIIANEDRHLNNFGALRDSTTLKWIGMAPLFDNGASFGFNKNTVVMGRFDEYECKPFRKTFEDELKLVKSLKWLDFEALSDIPDFVDEVFSDSVCTTFVGEDRIKTIKELLYSRIEYLRRIYYNYAV